MVGTTSTSQDQAQQDKSNNDHDLERRQIELEFPKELDADVIDKYDCDQENCDENTRVDFRAR